MTTLQIFCLFSFSASSLHLSLDRINLERISTEKRRPIFSRPGQNRVFRSRRLQETRLFMCTAISRSISLRVGYFFPASLPAVMVIHTVIVEGARRSHFPLPARRERPSLSFSDSALLTRSLTHSFLLFSRARSSHENLPAPLLAAPCRGAPSFIHLAFGARSEKEEVQLGSATR